MFETLLVLYEQGALKSNGGPHNWFDSFLTNSWRIIKREWEQKYK
jgi:hypothetical protein